MGMSWDAGSPARGINRETGLPLVSPANMVPVQVVRRQVVAPDVVSVQIVLPGTEQAPAPYLAGQFVTLALPTPHETLYRSYSLCGDGDASHPWELTIKRMQQGAVSTYFYQYVDEGTLLYSSLPRGTFTLPPRVRPDMLFGFVAAGSGITPIMGMLRAIARMPEEQRPPVQLHYASKSPMEIIFRDELMDMDPDQTWLQQFHYLSSRSQRMTADAIIERAGRGGSRAHWYMCGPESLKRELQAKLTERRVPASHVHSEVFASAARPAYRIDTRSIAGTGKGGGLRVVETGAQLDVQPHETLLVALERHGYRPECSCRVGACGACKLKLVEGQVDVVGEILSPAERQAGYVLGCIAHPIGDVAIASGGRPPAGVAVVAAVGGASGAGRQATRQLVRMASLVGVSTLVLGAWGLTNHRPDSWAATAPTAAATVAPTAVAAHPTATHAASGGAVSGTHPAPPPTATPAKTGAPPPPPAPTATPKPKPAPTPTVCTVTSTTTCP